MKQPAVLLFVDNSNIFLSAKDEAQKIEGRSARDKVRIHFEALINLALAGRPLADAFVIGSIPPEERAIWDRLEEATGVRPELYERGSVTGGEQGLDQCLQVHMLRAISDFPEPQIAVLMTGDGAGYDDGVGFHADLERMHGAGWGIEVVSWRTHCRRALREWATKNGIFVPLDDYYHSVTFLERERRVKPIDLSLRKLATPRVSPVKMAEQQALLQAETKMQLLERELAEMRAQQALKVVRKAKYDRQFLRGSK